MVSWISKINAVTILISELFVTLPKKSKAVTLDQIDLLKKIVYDFSSRKKHNINFFTWLVGSCARSKTHRINQHGEVKLKKEFDVLRMIRHHRLLAS
jgi:hypothetical protein